MKIVFHIGIHKTGTTAIQRFCTRNRDALAQRGVLYPSCFVKFDGHHPLPWALGVRHPERIREIKAEEIARSILQEAKERGAETVILSSEEFRNLESPALIRNLKQLFPDVAAEVVVYLRRQDDFLISKYGQHVRMYSIRYSGTLHDFYLRHNFINRYNYWELTNRWANVFGNDAMRVRVFDRTLFPGGNVLMDFFDAIGFDSSAFNLDLDHQVNANLQPMSLEIMRRLNARPMDEKTHHAALRLLSQMSFDERLQYELLSRSNRRDLMMQFNHTNSLVAKKWFGIESGVLFRGSDKLDSGDVATALAPSAPSALVDALLECLALSLGQAQPARTGPIGKLKEAWARRSEAGT